MARPKSENKFIRKDITMEPKQYQKLIEHCEIIERPMSWVIREALAEYLVKYAF